VKYFYSYIVLFYSMFSLASTPSNFYFRLVNCQEAVNNSTLRSECVQLVVKDGLMKQIADVFEVMSKDADDRASTRASFILTELRQGQYYERNRNVSKDVLMKYHQFIHDHGFTFRGYLDLAFKKPFGLDIAIQACLLHADEDCVDKKLFSSMSLDQRKEFVTSFISNFKDQYMDVFSLAQLMPPQEVLGQDKFFLAAQLYQKDQAKGKEAIRKFAEKNSTHLCEYQMALVLRTVSLSHLTKKCGPMFN